MDYIYKTKIFADNRDVAKWLNSKKIKAEDVISISAYCENHISHPRYALFYKEYKNNK